MRKSTIIASIGAILLTLNINTLLNLNATDKVRMAVEDNHDISHYYYTENHYEEDNSEELRDIKNELTELKEIQKEQEIINEQTQITKEPWKGPKSYKCNYAAGYPAICGYCGKQGQIHYDIKEWQDTEGTYHLTHVGCGQLYCDSIFVEPRIEESYKVR